MTKSRRKYTDNCAGIVVEPDGAPENVGIGAKFAVPQSIADYDGGRETEREILRTIQPSNLQLVRMNSSRSGCLAPVKFTLPPAIVLTSSNTPARSVRSSSSGLEKVTSRNPTPGWLKKTLTKRSGARYDRGRSKTAFTMLKIGAFAPTPKANVKTATTVKPGLLRNHRSP